MPIYNFGEHTIVFLGHGDVLISPARSEGKEHCDELVFYSAESPRAIGEWAESYPDENKELPPVVIRLAFDSLESLDVVAERLDALREIMVAKDDGADATWNEYRALQQSIKEAADGKAIPWDEAKKHLTEND